VAGPGNEVDERSIVAFAGPVQGVQVVAPKDRGDDRQRITGLKQCKIHQKTRRPSVAVDKRVKGHKVLMSYPIPRVIVPIVRTSRFYKQEFKISWVNNDNILIAF
jgi:hypothetical protein